MNITDIISYQSRNPHVFHFLTAKNDVCVLSLLAKGLWRSLGCFVIFMGHGVAHLPGLPRSPPPATLDVSAGSLIDAGLGAGCGASQGYPSHHGLQRFQYSDGLVKNELDILRLGCPTILGTCNF